MRRHEAAQQSRLKKGMPLLCRDAPFCALQANALRRQPSVAARLHLEGPLLALELVFLLHDGGRLLQVVVELGDAPDHRLKVGVGYLTAPLPDKRHRCGACKR